MRPAHSAREIDLRDLFASPKKTGFNEARAFSAGNLAWVQLSPSSAIVLQ